MLTISGKSKDLGGFTVTRLLPHVRQRAVGPFIFLDHMGPADFPPGAGVDVRAHPHIGLATVTFLFSGALIHRDSLGTVQEIRPGDVNWMTAGSGIVHSERSPEPRVGGDLHGLQAWVALPNADEEMPPAFEHYPAASMPKIALPGISLQLIAGEILGIRSPVRTRSAILYLAGSMAAGARFELPAQPLERALYVVNGQLRVGDTDVPAGTLLVLPENEAIDLSAVGDSHIAILGGEPLDGPRHLFWNFVSSRPERIELAKEDWRAQRFPVVPGEHEFIPLP